MQHLIVPEQAFWIESSSDKTYRKYLPFENFTL